MSLYQHEQRNKVKSVIKFKISYQEKKGFYNATSCTPQCDDTKKKQAGWLADRQTR